ncbi:hydroxyethylthiazole kinase [Bacillus andreraoultii]|uniref:hydroxyethylthiazole kinase n=1 Tax=Bacillus andreraoultii TaxID=1499685 RepID=UPI00067F597A|nr:hydroxyethylthiazole kinase [Bacillus andreraoultii]
MNSESFKQLLTTVQEKKPLIHQITNTVTMNDCANVTLAIGASPVMAFSKHEVADMVSLANALVINFGTIDEYTFHSMLIAGNRANELRIPVVVDPVGAGATPYRTKVIQEFIHQIDVAIIRGNISEIDALLNGASTTRGVDAGEVSESKHRLAENAAKKWDTVVAISGETDFISDGTNTYKLMNGDRLLTMITGTGCMSAALIASFAAISKDFLLAAIAGTSVMSIAGEVAKQTIGNGQKSLGTYKENVMNTVSNFSDQSLYENIKICKSNEVVI